MDKRVGWATRAPTGCPYAIYGLLCFCMMSASCAQRVTPAITTKASTRDYADAWGSGSDDSTARKAAIRTALAELRGTYVESSVTVLNDQLVEDQINSFAWSPDLRVNTLVREVQADGSVRICVRVTQRQGNADVAAAHDRKPAEGNPDATRETRTRGATAIAGTEIADAFGAQNDASREAGQVLGHQIDICSAASTEVALFHVDGRPFESVLNSTDDVSKSSNGIIELRVVVRVRAKASYWDQPPADRMPKLLSAIAKRILPKAVEVIAGENLGEAPLSRATVRKGRATARGLQRPAADEASVLLPSERQARAGNGFEVHFDQYILPLEALPSIAKMCTAVRIAVRDSTGSTISAAIVPLTNAPFLIDLSTLPKRNAISPVSGSEQSFGKMRVAGVGWPTLTWGFHYESGPVGSHLVLSPFAITGGTITGGAMAVANSVEALAMLRMEESALRRAVTITAESMSHEVTLKPR